MLAQGGWTFADHVKDPNTQATLKSAKWDFVVLQEQSEIPAFEQSRTASMYPAARTLVAEVRDAQAAPVFFQTWGHLNGDPQYGIPDYISMQNQLDAGYGQIARELAAPVAPVGDAWRLAWQQTPSLALWQSDSSHPTEQGTYLAACVFYAVIFQQSPEGLDYVGHVPKDTARTLQAVAGQFVVKKPSK